MPGSTAQQAAVSPGPRALVLQVLPEAGGGGPQHPKGPLERWGWQEAVAGGLSCSCCQAHVEGEASLREARRWSLGWVPRAGGGSKTVQWLPVLFPCRSGCKDRAGTTRSEEPTEGGGEEVGGQGQV